MKTSTTTTTSWFLCKRCEFSFPKKILLILHEKEMHPHHPHSHHHSNNDIIDDHCPDDELMAIIRDDNNGDKNSVQAQPNGIPMFEMEALEFASSSSEISEGSLDQGSEGLDEPKAEPCMNFLDHVTTRLARGKRKVSYSCNFCGRDLQTMPQVKEHIPIHINYKNFPCDRPTCPKSFASLYDQLRHQDRHLKKEKKKKGGSDNSNINGANLKTANDVMMLISSSCGSSNSSTVGDRDRDRDADDPVMTTYLTRYCLCNQIAYGDMVACDRRNCPKKWFHFSCVGLKSKAPRGTWHCPLCKARARCKRKRGAVVNNNHLTTTSTNISSRSSRSSSRFNLEVSS